MSLALDRFQEFLDSVDERGIDLNVFRDKNNYSVLHRSAGNPHLPESFLIKLIEHLDVNQELND